MYSPLPSSLTIKTSGIHGLGLFATKNIKTETNLGITHVFNVHFNNGYIRTPLGGFLNHSDNPNCTLIDSDNLRYKELKVLRNIEIGEELTVKYTMYSLINSTKGKNAQND